jgi:hypothetical protein
MVNPSLAYLAIVENQHIAGRYAANVLESCASGWLTPKVSKDV